MNTSSVSKGFLFPLLVVSGLVLWIVLFWTPNRRQIKEARSGVNFLEEKIKKDIPEAQILTIQRLVDSLQVALNRKESRIYPSEEMGELVHFIQTTFKPYDLTVVTVRPAYETLSDLSRDTTGAAELPSVIELKGRFAGFTRLMDDLDRLPFAFKVNALDLYREDPEKASVDIELKGIVFFRKTGTTRAAVAGPADEPVRR